MSIFDSRRLGTTAGGLAGGTPGALVGYYSKDILNPNDQTKRLGAAAVGGSLLGAPGTVAGYYNKEIMNPSDQMKRYGATVLGGAIGGVPGAAAGWMATGQAAKGGSSSGFQSSMGDKPELSPWVGMNQENIRAMDLYKPTTVSGADIETQMQQSPWYKMALEKQGAEQSRLMDQAARQQAGALAGARTQLAMRGGLRSGAAERLAASGAENLSRMAQEQRQTGAVERGQLGMQGADLASRLAQFNAGQLTEGQARNIGAGISELDKERAYNLAKYQEEMKAYGAGKTAEALGREPKPGLFSDPLGYFGQYMK